MGKPRVKSGGIIITSIILAIGLHIISKEVTQTPFSERSEIPSFKAAQPGIAATLPPLGRGKLQIGVDPALVKKNIQIFIGSETPGFSPHHIEVQANQTVNLTLSNQSVPDAKSLHNFVLVPADKVNEVAQEAQPNSQDILAFTQLIAPGEANTITFHIPDKASEYRFICTYPGHSHLENGVFLVRRGKE
jgi:azurin